MTIDGLSGNGADGGYDVVDASLLYSSIYDVVDHAPGVDEESTFGCRFQSRQGAIGLYFENKDERKFHLKKVFEEVMIDPILSQLLVVFELLVICIISRQKT